jgi:uracil-DNA glycosylase family 4
VAHEKVARFRDWTYWGRPVPGFGDAAARVLVVGLAPAAHGGNRTGRVFTGDESGNWLYRALHAAGFANQPTSVARDDGLRLTDAYVTAAARCAPPGNRPTPDELARCQPFLVDELDRLDRLRVVVVLGKIAHDAFLAALAARGDVVPRPRPRFAHGLAHRLPNGLLLVCSYHPSQQNTFTGRLTRTMLDAVFSQAAAALDDRASTSPRRRGT